MGVAVAVMMSGIAQAGDEEGEVKGGGKDQCGKGPHKGPGKAFCEKADTNKDDKLSLDEFKAACTKGDAEVKFQKADADKDGFVTPEELKAARRQHRTMGKECCKPADAKECCKKGEAKTCDAECAKKCEAKAEEAPAAK